MAKNNFQYGGWNYYTLQCAWHVALESWQWIHQVAAPCSVIRGSGMACHWIRPAAAPCNVICSSGITALIRQVAAPCNVTCSVALQSRHWIRQVAAPWSVAGGSGMTCHWIRPNVHHIGILHLVLILTTSPQSICHSAPVSKILSKSDHPWQEKNDVMSIFKMADLSHLGFWVSIMVALKSPITTY